jgi:hypothetical protein
MIPQDFSLVGSFCFNVYPLFLLVQEAQKKKLGKKKHAVFVELRAPHRAKGAF